MVLSEHQPVPPAFSLPRRENKFLSIGRPPRVTRPPPFKHREGDETLIMTALGWLASAYRENRAN
jgi:hypothetical protein